jgi:hypothetical protein
MGHTDPTAEAIQDARCDALAQEERQVAREDARETREAEAAEDARSNEAARRDSARLAAIRAAPKVPELGSTIAESRVICEHQRGQFISKTDTTYTCRIVGLPLFACTIGDSLRTDRCDGYYEGAELADVRQKVESKFGPPTSETVDAGFRVFGWETESTSLYVKMYAQGVRVTTSSKPLTTKAPAPPATKGDEIERELH